jgi:F-type H+-transporting ATPase subunit a
MIWVVLALVATAANLLIPSSLRAPNPHVVLASEKLFHVGGIFYITNTMLATWATMLVLIVVSLLATRRMKLVPGGLQNAVELIIEMFYNFVEGIAGDKARMLFPLVATLFFFIMLSNWMGLLPGYGSIWVELGHGEHAHRAHLLRSANTGLNTTLALAFISVVGTQIFGFRVLGFRFIDRYFPVIPIIQFFRKPPPGEKRPGGMVLVTRILGLFPGALEFFAELIKLVSFSFRLFGNIFAGEVLLVVMAFLLPYVISLPFMGLELFVGFIQAFIFATLTLSFSMAAVAHHGEH